MKPKEALLILGLATGAACAPGFSANRAPQPASAISKESKSRVPDSMPFSMMGASAEEVAQKTRKLLEVLGPFPKIGTQADGSMVECEVAPDRDMAMSMAIVNVLQDLNQNPAPSNSPASPAPKSGKGTHFPQILLKGGSSEALSSGEILSCIHAERNPSVNPR